MLEVRLEEQPAQPGHAVVPEVDMGVGERLRERIVHDDATARVRQDRIRGPGVKVTGIANVPYVTPIVSARTSRSWSIA